MIVNEPALDWLTLGTFSQPVADTLLAGMEHAQMDKLKDEKRMQYEGVRRGPMFIGSAMQQSLRHYMFIASGEGAMRAFPFARALPLKCSRIDVQCTIPLPRPWNHRKTYEALKLANPNLSLTLVESGDGFDTLYIGKRISRRFARLYIKPDGQGEPWLRYEVEYKKELAQQVWDMSCAEEHTTAIWGQMLLGEMLDIKGFPPAMEGFMLTLQAYGLGKRPGGERRETGGATWKWLKSQVDPAIRRAMYDHEQGHQVRALIREWYLESGMIDDGFVLA